MDLTVVLNAEEWNSVLLCLEPADNACLSNRAASCQLASFWASRSMFFRDAILREDEKLSTSTQPP